MPIFGNKTEDTKKTAKKSAKVVVKKEAASMKDLYKGETAPEVKETSDEKVEVKKEKKIAMKRDYRVLVKPLITEKGSQLGIQNKYLFAVSNDANKVEVAKAIKEAYGVNPVKVNILNVEGKIKMRGRYFGKRKDWKKAIVTLPAGKTIQVYEGI